LECVRLAGSLPPPALLPALGKAGASSTHSKRWRAVREFWPKRISASLRFRRSFSASHFKNAFIPLVPFHRNLALLSEAVNSNQNHEDKAQAFQSEVLFGFPLSPQHPFANLVQRPDGNFYGTSAY